MLFRSLSAKLGIKATTSGSTSYVLKIDNSASDPILYIRDDKKVRINKNSFTSYPFMTYTASTYDYISPVFEVIDGMACVSSDYNTSGIAQLSIIGDRSNSAPDDGRVVAELQMLSDSGISGIKFGVTNPSGSVPDFIFSNGVYGRSEEHTSELQSH